MPTPTDSLPADVVEAWRAGHKVEAIKRLRESTAMGLAEAKAAVDALDRHGATASGTASAPALPEMLKALQASGALPPDIVEAWQRGDKIEAFRRFAAAAKEGRIQGKVNVKAHATSSAQPHTTLDRPKHVAHHPLSPGDMLAPGEVPRTQRGPAAIVLLVVALVALIWIYTVLS